MTMILERREILCITDEFKKLIGEDIVSHVKATIEVEKNSDDDVNVLVNWGIPSTLVDYIIHSNSKSSFGEGTRRFIYPVIKLLSNKNSISYWVKVEIMFK